MSKSILFFFFVDKKFQTFIDKLNKFFNPCPIAYKIVGLSINASSIIYINMALK